jgi:hypothetical protein
MRCWERFKWVASVIMNGNTPGAIIEPRRSCGSQPLRFTALQVRTLNHSPQEDVKVDIHFKHQVTSWAPHTIR